jgi:hypothetical protein
MKVQQQNSQATPQPLPPFPTAHEHQTLNCQMNFQYSLKYGHPELFSYLLTENFATHRSLLYYTEITLVIVCFRNEDGVKTLIIAAMCTPWISQCSCIHRLPVFAYFDTSNMWIFEWCDLFKTLHMYLLFCNAISYLMYHVFKNCSNSYQCW